MSFEPVEASIGEINVGPKLYEPNEVGCCSVMAKSDDTAITVHDLIKALKQTTNPVTKEVLREILRVVKVSDGHTYAQIGNTQYVPYFVGQQPVCDSKTVLELRETCGKHYVTLKELNVYTRVAPSVFKILPFGEDHIPYAIDQIKLCFNVYVYRTVVYKGDDDEEEKHDLHNMQGMQHMMGPYNSMLHHEMDPNTTYDEVIMMQQRRVIGEYDECPHKGGKCECPKNADGEYEDGLVRLKSEDTGPDQEYDECPEQAGSPCYCPRRPDGSYADGKPRRKLRPESKSRPETWTVEGTLTSHHHVYVIDLLMDTLKDSYGETQAELPSCAYLIVSLNGEVGLCR